MCGILACLDRCSTGVVDEESVAHIVNLMFHRGPDDSGVVRMGPIIFGHRRLSIIDIEQGHQPMVDNSGRRMIVYNGEIYNFIELRDELIGSGYDFRTRSDTEVLLALYDRFGTAMLDKLNGMFAFGIWDDIQKELFIARDRLGIKPLYYTETKHGLFLFASEIKSLLAFPGVERIPNLEGLSSYFSFRRVMGSETFFKKIYMLEPGCYMKVSDTGIKKLVYWTLPLDKYENVDDDLLLAKTDELLREAVRRRLISDVPLGAFLSGGLDSSAVVAIMSEMLNEPVKTYSIGFDDKNYNELGYCRKVAEVFETDHHEFMIDEKEYIDLIPDLIWKKDEPLSVANEIALYRLASNLKNDITVVLSGEGADELFAGYGRIFRSPYDYERLQSAPFAGGSGKREFKRAIKDQYGKVNFSNEVDHFLSIYKWMDTEDKRTFLSGDTWEQIGEDIPLRERIRNIFNRLSQMNHYDKYLYFFQRYHLENLLRRVDMTTMAASVEARVPFVDHELVEHVMRLPMDKKLKWKSGYDYRKSRYLSSAQISEKHDIPKYILRKLMSKKLPADIINRKKMGFPVPLDKFFRSRFYDFVIEIACDSRTRERGIFDTASIYSWLEKRRERISPSDAMKVWMLVNVELWFRIYFDEVNYESDYSRSWQGRETVPAY